MVKKLGSLLGDTEEVIRRKQLASAAMSKMYKVWIRGRKVHIKKRLKLYNTLKPILTYNSCTWGLTKTETESLNAFHRRQLRKIWKFNWKSKIRNEKIYEICNCSLISNGIKTSTWNMFGHSLRMNRETPAWKAMIYYFESRYSEKKFRGRRRTTLVTVLNEDIRATKNRVNLPILEPLQSLEDMRSIAEDRKPWSNIVNRM